jgi:uncharacterized membrane protein YhaH (DUF805 family)
MSDRLEAVASGRPLANGRGKRNWLDGRASRKEYWLWVGPIAALGSVLVLAGVPGAWLLFGLPIFFFWIRRLHDIGVSGWIAPLINIALAVLAFGFGAALPPEAAVLMMLLARLTAIVVLGLWPGQPRGNAFGPPPGLRDVSETFS